MMDSTGSPQVYLINMIKDDLGLTMITQHKINSTNNEIMRILKPVVSKQIASNPSFNPSPDKGIKGDIQQ
ncbi:MAG TPA: hypothetical protein PLX69_18930 [Leptospiraceae bacterium]|nr:hypothetical protein [Leptospiraceae bacterium]HRG76643.1 hypothetical protein [Leptospiraceae bacterium]